ncbi:MAG: DMT family transporter [Bacteroides sp.]|nr:DMT family transporter [Ruminococcus flavefaciens]MCM1555748.1 DMT family transporter [Bacteroides sp.]
MSNNKAKGYILGALAAATYGMNPLFTLPLYSAGMDPDSVLFFRYALALPVLALMLKARGRSFSIRRSDVFPLACMGLLLALSSVSLFYSYRYMDAGIASTLLFVYPVLVAVGMAAFFKEKMGAATVFSILMTVFGVSLLCRSSDGSSLSLTGILLVMVSSVTYAVYIVSVNRIRRFKEMPTIVMSFYMLSFSTVFLFLLVGCGTRLQVVPHWYQWGYLICLALLPTVVSFLATTQAIHYIGPTPTAILGALEPVTAVCFGVLLFNETMTVRIFLGIVLIIAAVTIIVAQGNITAYLVRFRKLFPKLKKGRK